MCVEIETLVMHLKHILDRDKDNCTNRLTIVADVLLC